CWARSSRSTRWWSTPKTAHKDIEKANEAGVLLFISKPFDVDQFLRKITSKRQFSILLKKNQS
ncbi:MAG TPA: hypothetical protein PLN99_03380, partial [Daejeonella sp.]|nr:hypothetical protein [Daejeonella sp.]